MSDSEDDRDCMAQRMETEVERFQEKKAFQRWWDDYARRSTYIHPEIKIALCKTFAKDAWDACNEFHDTGE